MEIGTILNTKMAVAVVAGTPIHFDMQHAMAHELQQQHYPHPSYMNGRIKSEAGSERGISPHPSDAGRYTSQPPPPIQAYQTMPNALANGIRYTSPTPQMNSPIPMLHNSYVPNPPEHTYAQQAPQPEQQPTQVATRSGTGESGPPKAFACSTCGKGFARRSDLARHERIHSGVRPHVCDYHGCGKQFIQRSALTVHQRVHTGEKPHMCERCGKPFSDSSSLARHRRIHSGKRPYKCPYADCQKTFTRRTTLTRHQNHHTGTVEEAAAATAAALASHASAPVRATRSDIDEFSEVAASPIPTSSPHGRPLSLSPSASLAGVPSMHRQTTDYAYMGGMNVPPHLRGAMPQPSPRSSPALSSQPYTSAGANPSRPSLTSHPNPYGPPPILEPPTNVTQPQSASATSVHGSPHMTNMGWQSPSHQPIGSPTAQESYVYPEPNYGVPNAAMYYQNSGIRRPHSAEPDQYDPRPRMGGEIWAAPVQ